MIPGKDRNRQLNSGAPSGWHNVKPEIATLECDRNDKPLIYAIVSTWHDADIIYATVRNCFNNGIEKVFILDNNSPDDTVSEALRAGAIIAEIYETEYYDDDLRIRKQNNFVKHIVETERHRELWFITLDADELPSGYKDDTIQDTLGRLPGGIRTIGSKAIDLYPYNGQEYIPEKHPASCFTHGINRIAKFACNGKHWKHIALRYFNGRYDIAQSRGNHRPASPKMYSVVYGPAELELPIFHCPLRNKEAAIARLTELCHKKNDQGHHRSIGDDQVIQAQGAIKRFNSIESIYAGRWYEVELPHSQLYGRNIVGICPLPWNRLQPTLTYLEI